MDFLREWIMGIAGAAMIGVLVLAVTPKGGVRKVLQLGTALLLSIAVLRPLMGYSGDFSLDGALEGYRDEAVTKLGQDFWMGLIAEQTRAYIESKADTSGLSVSATVECRMGEDYPQPYRITIRSDRPDHARNVLAQTIEQDLQIPPERQVYQSN